MPAEIKQTGHSLLNNLALPVFSSKPQPSPLTAGGHKAEGELLLAHQRNANNNSALAGKKHLTNVGTLCGQVLKNNHWSTKRYLQSAYASFLSNICTFPVFLNFLDPFNLILDDSNLNLHKTRRKEGRLDGSKEGQMKLIRDDRWTKVLEEGRKDGWTDR